MSFEPHPEEERHPSGHALQRLHAGEIAGGEREAIRDHLAGCPVCQEKLQALVSCRESFREGHDQAAFLARVERLAAQPAPSSGAEGMGPGHRLALWVGLAAAAAGLLLLVLVSAGPIGHPVGPAGTGGGTRIKGAEVALDFLLLREGTPRPPLPSEWLHPGDRIQFRVSAPAGRFVFVLGVDEAGQLSLYHPASAEGSGPFPGGAGWALPSSVILDSTLGRERVFLLACDKPQPPARLIETLRGRYPDARLLLDEPRLPLPCDQATLVWKKR